MSIELEIAFPELRYLFGAYLNQDYDVHGPSLGDAVRAFARDENPAVVAALHADIARFLREQGGVENAALDAIDSGRAHPPGLSGRDYLRWIDFVLAEAARGHAAE
jgi:hypothetical protein